MNASKAGVPTDKVFVNAHSRKLLALPALLVIFVEVLTVAGEHMSESGLAIGVSIVLIATNFLAYGLAGWFAIYRSPSRPLLASGFAGVALLVVEMLARGISIGLSQSSEESDLFFFEAVRHVMPWAEDLSDTQLSLFGAAVQYLVFSPFYVALSVTGGLLGKSARGSYRPI